MADNNRSDLYDLKNLGVSSINILRAVGISTREELQRVGSVAAYCKILRRSDINTSKVMLYALEGALLGVEWKQLDTETKERLVAEAEVLLSRNREVEAD